MFGTCSNNLYFIVVEQETSIERLRIFTSLYIRGYQSHSHQNPIRCIVYSSITTCRGATNILLRTTSTSKADVAWLVYYLLYYIFQLAS